jgi:iron only hydrogenase large subunit-like protein
LGFVDQTDIISSLKILKDNSVKRVAIIAPSIASQFSPASFPQIVTALKKIGFDFIVEAAHGADLVLQEESKELVKKGKLIYSCCPSFVNYISSNFPNLKSYISTTPSPTIAACDEFKNSNPNSKFIFISPCAAKKLEFKTHKGYIDTVLTFEEISAIFEARKIECETLEETELNQATY